MKVTSLCRVITLILIFGAFLTAKSEERADSVVIAEEPDLQPLKSSN